ncbi:hypothetical protein [Sphingomonas turrisvirgatae]|nr:hypothetical protein [Sphingomonas turrisvirgatae]
MNINHTNNLPIELHIKRAKLSLFRRPATDSRTCEIARAAAIEVLG